MSRVNLTRFGEASVDFEEEEHTVQRGRFGVIDLFPVGFVFHFIPLTILISLCFYDLYFIFRQPMQLINAAVNL